MKVPRMLTREPCGGLHTASAFQVDAETTAMHVSQRDEISRSLGIRKCDNVVALQSSR